MGQFNHRNRDIFYLAMKNETRHLHVIKAYHK